MKIDAGGSMCYWSNLSVLERNAYDLLQVPVLLVRCRQFMRPVGTLEFGLEHLVSRSL